MSSSCSRERRGTRDHFLVGIPFVPMNRKFYCYDLLFAALGINKSVRRYYNVGIVMVQITQCVNMRTREIERSRVAEIEPTGRSRRTALRHSVIASGQVIKKRQGHAPLKHFVGKPE